MVHTCIAAVYQSACQCSCTTEWKFVGKCAILDSCSYFSCVLLISFVFFLVLLVWFVLYYPRRRRKEELANLNFSFLQLSHLAQLSSWTILVCVLLSLVHLIHLLCIICGMMATGTLPRHHDYVDDNQLKKSIPTSLLESLVYIWTFKQELIPTSLPESLTELEPQRQQRQQRRQ